jgi:hypothetical protein
MAKTLEQRIAQLEKLIADFFTGNPRGTKISPKPPGRKENAEKKTGRKASRRSSPRKSSRKTSRR